MNIMYSLVTRIHPKISVYLRKLTAKSDYFTDIKENRSCTQLSHKSSSPQLSDTPFPSFLSHLTRRCSNPSRLSTAARNQKFILSNAHRRGAIASCSLISIASSRSASYACILRPQESMACVLEDEAFCTKNVEDR